MQLRTIVDIPSLATRISHAAEGVLLGSCFAQNMAVRFRDEKFPVAANPFGILYNPASIAAALDMLAAGRTFSETDLHHHDGLWHSFSHHGSFSSPDPREALVEMNRAAARGSAALAVAGYAVITLGTAWIYERRGEVVANCHKLPGSEFTRRRMDVEEIVCVLGRAIAESLKGKGVILTVSPVRHIKDGLAENSRSKAILIEAAHRMADALPGVEYFPSYEIVCDELRDYRFYTPDMLHPSEQAADYIWQRFREAAMDPGVRELGDRLRAVTLAAAHRPLHPGTEQYEKFRRSMSARAHELQNAHPEVDLGDEITFFER